MAAVNTFDEVGERLVDEAGRLLDSEGPSALTLRRLATSAGTSTMAVYTRFGDKDGLLAAMHAVGFRRLGDALTAAAARFPDDPLAALAEMGLAYRQAAMDSPHLYNLMFGEAAPSFRPDEAGKAIADAAYEPLVAGVRNALEAGVLSGGTAERIALFLWAVSHGFVSLEISRKLDMDAGEAEAAYRDALVLSAVPFMRGG